MLSIKNLRKDKPNAEFDVKADRSSVLGNPYRMKAESDRGSVCNKYAEYFQAEIENNFVFTTELNRLLELYITHGKLNLYCWCAPKRCHAETIKHYIAKKASEKTLK